MKKFIAYDDAVIALTHARIIDGTGAPAQDNRTLVLRNGRSNRSVMRRRRPARA